MNTSIRKQRNKLGDRNGICGRKHNLCYQVSLQHNTLSGKLTHLLKNKLRMNNLLYQKMILILKHLKWTSNKEKRESTNLIKSLMLTKRKETS